MADTDVHGFLSGAIWVFFFLSIVLDRNGEKCLARVSSLWVYVPTSFSDELKERETVG